MATRTNLTVGASTLNVVIYSIWMFMFILRAVHTQARPDPEDSARVKDLPVEKNQWSPHNKPCTEEKYTADSIKHFAIFLDKIEVQQCTYTVAIHTGNIENAATDAHVNVELFNKIGASILFVDLESGGENYKRGQTDTFSMVGNCVSEICKIHLSHDDAGVNPSWFVNSVSVSMNAETTVFNIYEWLAKDEPPYSLSYINSLC